MRTDLYLPGDASQTGKKARLWWKKRIERESSILGDASDNSAFAADFAIPYENVYTTPPPSVYVELKSLALSPPAGESVATPLSELTATPSLELGGAPELPTYPANVNFSVTSSEDEEKEEEHSFSLSYDVNFVTAHPCSPSHRVKLLKSPTSPTVPQFDFSSANFQGKSSGGPPRLGMRMVKMYNS
jgi:hypothetical protein